MKVEVSKHNLDIVEISPHGDLTTTTSEEFAERLKIILDSGVQKAILNFAHISYVSSLGIGEIITGWDRLRMEGGIMKFAGMSEGIYKVFDLVGLTSRFEIFPDVQSALDSFSVSN